MTSFIKQTLLTLGLVLMVAPVGVAAASEDRVPNGATINLDDTYRSNENSYSCFSGGDLKADGSDCYGVATSATGNDSTARIAQMAKEQCVNNGCSNCRTAMCNNPY